MRTALRSSSGVSSRAVWISSEAVSPSRLPSETQRDDRMEESMDDGELLAVEIPAAACARCGRELILEVLASWSGPIDVDWCPVCDLRAIPFPVTR